MPERTRLTSRTAAALVAAQVVWAAAGFAFPALPGWKMFASVSPTRARLVDATGEAVEVYDLVPKDVYLVNRGSVRAVVAWQCRARPDRAPWRLEWADGTTEEACRR